MQDFVPVHHDFRQGAIIIAHYLDIMTREGAGVHSQCIFRQLGGLHGLGIQSYELGLLTTQQFFDQIRTASTFSGTLVEFSESFADIFSPIQPMIELHGELRKQRTPTYIFSNTNDLAVEHIRRKFPFFSDFNGYVLSYEHGVMKPAARLYEIVERASGRKGDEIIYIDDRSENVEAGTARGWQTVLHEDPAKTREALQKLGALNHS